MKSFVTWVKDYPTLKVLANDIEMQRLAHAYLILGDGEDVWLCVRSLAQSLQCPEQPGEGCGECVVCTQIENDCFVDLRRVQPSGKAKFIKIEDIADLQDLIQTKPMVSDQRLCFVQDVQCFDKEAANAFLKILEEPPRGTLWILSTTNVYEVLETLVSRCRRVLLNTVSVERFVYKDLEASEEIREALLQILGEPQREALSVVTDRINDYVHKAKNQSRGNKEYLEYILGLVSLVLRDSAVLQVCQDSTPKLMWPEAQQASGHMAHYMDEHVREALWERLVELRSHIHYNMNLKLSLSHLLSPLTEVAA